MTRRVYVYDGSSARYVLARGRVSDTLTAHGIPALWNNVERGHLVRRERVSDLLCALQADGLAVRTVAGDPK